MYAHWYHLDTDEGQKTRGIIRGWSDTSRCRKIKSTLSARWIHYDHMFDRMPAASFVLAVLKCGNPLLESVMVALTWKQLRRLPGCLSRSGNGRAGKAILQQVASLSVVLLILARL